MKIKKIDVEKAGCVPLRRKDDKIEVCLVSSRRVPDQMVFPKGTVENGEKLVQTARRETFEEAGLIGEIIKSPMLVDENGAMVRYPKARSCFFPMIVEEEVKNWPEKSRRKRKWVPIDKLLEKRQKRRYYRFINKLARRAYLRLDEELAA